MIRFTSFLFFALALTFTACQEQLSEEEDSCCAKPLAADKLHGGTHTASAIPTAAMTDMSLYNLDSDWQNQQGEVIKLEQLQGKVQLVAMIYTHCSYACPRIIADLKRIENGLEQYQREDVGIVLVTMDPARDTPARLQEFAVSNRLDPTAGFC